MRVASFTGAWIETISGIKSVNAICVASFTGAWIETSKHPGILIYGYVASFTGAWIETEYVRGEKAGEPRSHPLRVRGLKPSVGTNILGAGCRILYGCVD